MSRDTWVPSYSLYGERSPSALDVERCHCESIPARSRLHHWEIQPHRHDLFLQVLVIRAGGGEARLEDRALLLKAPCALVVPAGLVHGFRFSETIQGQVITAVQASLPVALVGALTEPLHISGNAEGLDWDRLTTLVDVLVDSFATLDAWRGAAVQAALHLVLAQLATAHGVRAAAGQLVRARQHVRRYYQLVERHFREHRDLAFYADALGLTPTQLNRVCRSERGLSALAVIQRRVLAEAERDLAYTQLSVKALALSLGFPDASYFSRFFQRHVGQTPGQFRAGAHRRFLQTETPPAAPAGEA